MSKKTSKKILKKKIKKSKIKIGSGKVKLSPLCSSVMEAGGEGEKPIVSGVATLVILTDGDNNKHLVTFRGDRIDTKKGASQYLKNAFNEMFKTDSPHSFYTLPDDDLWFKVGKTRITFNDNEVGGAIKQHLQKKNWILKNPNITNEELVKIIRNYTNILNYFDEYYIEISRGGIETDDNDNPESAAKRELKEEFGLDTDRLQLQLEDVGNTEPRNNKTTQCFVVNIDNKIFTEMNSEITNRDIELSNWRCVHDFLNFLPNKLEGENQASQYKILKNIKGERESRNIEIQPINFDISKLDSVGSLITKQILSSKPEILPFYPKSSQADRGAGSSQEEEEEENGPVEEVSAQDNLTEIIALNLPPKELYNLCLTDKSYSQICKNDNFFETKIQQDFGEPGVYIPKIPSSSWKETFHYFNPPDLVPPARYGRGAHYLRDGTVVLVDIPGSRIEWGDLGPKENITETLLWCRVIPARFPIIINDGTRDYVQKIGHSLTVRPLTGGDSFITSTYYIKNFERPNGRLKNFGKKIE